MTKVTDLAVAKKMVSNHSSATTRGIKYDMSFKRTKQLLKQKTCFYTGVKFTESVNPNATDPGALTLDRVDNTLGYTDDNVVACTMKVNSMKGSLTIEDITMLYKGVTKVNKRNDKKDPKRLKPVLMDKLITKVA